MNTSRNTMSNATSQQAKRGFAVVVRSHFKYPSN